MSVVAKNPSMINERNDGSALKNLIIILGTLTPDVEFGFIYYLYFKMAIYISRGVTVMQIGGISDSYSG